MNPLFRMSAAIVAAVALLAGCTSSEGAQDAAGCNYDTTIQGVQVSGASGAEPTIQITDNTPATELGVADLCVGDGAEVTQSATVTVNYLGVALSTAATFDSSFTNGSPVTFGVNQVIEGWQQGLLGMKAGGTRLLVIPGELAYGDRSPGPGIGPNETLVFVVDLIEVQ